MINNLTNKTQDKTSPFKDVRKLTLTAVIIAINIAAYYINVPTPWGSMIHLGNIVMFATAIIFGAEIGGLSGGMSAAIFDLLTGHTHYILWSLIIKGVSGYALGKITHMKGKDGMDPIFNVIGGIVCGLINLVGYVICWIFLYNTASAIARIPSSLISSAIGFIGIFLAMPIRHILKKNKLYRF